MAEIRETVACLLPVAVLRSTADGGGRIRTSVVAGRGDPVARPERAVCGVRSGSCEVAWPPGAPGHRRGPPPCPALRGRPRLAAARRCTWAGGRTGDRRRDRTGGPRGRTTARAAARPRDRRPDRPPAHRPRRPAGSPFLPGSYRGSCPGSYRGPKQSDHGAFRAPLVFRCAAVRRVRAAGRTAGRPSGQEDGQDRRAGRRAGRGGHVADWRAGRAARWPAAGCGTARAGERAGVPYRLFRPCGGAGAGGAAPRTVPGTPGRGRRRRVAARVTGAPRTAAAHRRPGRLRTASGPPSGPREKEKAKRSPGRCGAKSRSTSYPIRAQRAIPAGSTSGRHRRTKRPGGPPDPGGTIVAPASKISTKLMHYRKTALHQA
jgi:hypothetical protein